jgi:shikimate dehydrogenase
MPAEAIDISARTGLVCVLGHPVRHSLSPSIHNAAFRHQGLDLAYVAFDVPAERLSSALLGLRALGVHGANLTLPHKEAVLPLLDEVDPLAARVGAVNTLVHDESVLRGYNTDISGFMEALRVLLPEGARGMECLVVGAGGAARAVVAALVEDEASRVWVCNRTHARAVSLCATASSWSRVACEAVELTDVETVARRAQVIVNATSVGLAAPVKDFAIHVDTVHSGQVLLDLVYGARTTALVEAALARGARAIDGREMLVRQAAGSYRLWTGQDPPLDVMRARCTL